MLTHGPLPPHRGPEQLGLQGGTFWVRTELFEEGVEGVEGGPLSFVSLGRSPRRRGHTEGQGTETALWASLLGGGEGRGS